MAIKVTPGVALAAYLAMPNKRAGGLRKLAAILTEAHGEGAAPVHTLGKWSKKFQWVAAARKHDAEVGAKIAENVQKAQVKAGFDAVTKLNETAAKCLAVAMTALDGDPKLIKNADDLAKMLSSAVELLKEALIRTQGPAPGINVNFVSGEDFGDLREKFGIPMRKTNGASAKPH